MRSASGIPKPTAGSNPTLWTPKPPNAELCWYWYRTDPPMARLFVGNQNAPGANVSRSELPPPLTDACAYETVPNGTTCPRDPKFVSARAAAPSRSNITKAR